MSERVAADRLAAPSSVGRRCADCLHFDGAADTLEAEIPGLVVMSSGYASVRADDGLCRLHDRYLSGRSHCEGFERRIVRMPLEEESRLKPLPRIRSD